ncbi:MAG: hypothetical protein OXG64_06025 [Chloroflexi bacterium]|nr:hypothetical protein [Chloroflexota bacterium]
MDVERTVVNECEAMFIPAGGSDRSEPVGLLLAGLQSSTLLRMFPAWTEAWQAAGFAIASYDFKDDRYTWGADAGVATFTGLLEEARQRWSVRRPIVCGSSRGGLTALVWAHRNPGVPVAWFGMNPVMNLGPFYELEGRAQSLNAAHGIRTKGELLRDVCPRANPVDLAADLAWLPMRTWQGLDDEVTPPSELETFDAAIRKAAGSHSIIYGPGGHATAEGPRDQFDASAQLAFAQWAESGGANALSPD